MENNLDSQLVSQALNFHGQQLSRFLEEEAGDALKDLSLKDVDYHLYHKRIKELSFQDRSLRLRLHHFIGKKALFLFQKHSLSYFSSKAFDKGSEDYYAIMPPIETFMGVPSNDRRNQFWELVKPGDLVICSVQNNLIKGITVKIVAFDAGKNLEIWDLGIKGLIPSCNIPYMEEEYYKTLQFNDSIRCEVVSCSNVSLVLSLIPRLSSTEIQYQYKLGKISTSDFPLSYKASKASKGETYNSLLQGSCSFHNPNNVMYLSNQFGLTLEDNKMSSLFKCCQGTYRKSDCSVMLKRKQGAKWALRNVADGIAYFKKGNMTEAFQCLNQALKFDPENVEALVARGALSANGGAFSKAVEDFELALKINPNHQNAKKYMGETLLAIGKRYEDEKNLDEALKTYHLCLEHIPGHKEAMEFIAAIKQSKSQDDLLMLTDIKVHDPEVKEKIRQLLKESTKKKSKAGKSKKKKKKYSSSSSASSSTSSEDSDDSSNTKLKRKRSNSKIEEIKEQSLSPLSKRMGMLERGHNVSGYPQCETLTGPVTSSHDFKLLTPMGQKLRSSEDLEYEEKVRKFLEQTMSKSEDKSEKKKSEKKDEKKKKKKDKKEKKKKEKLKKKDKSKKKDSKLKSDKKCEEIDVKPDELGESSLHELKDLEAKLSAYYAKVESSEAVKDKKEKKITSDSKKKKKKRTSRGKNKKKKHESSESSEDSSSSESGSSESDASSSSSTSSSSSEDSKPKKKKKKSKDSKSKSKKKSKASSKDNEVITTKSLDKRISDKPIPKLVASHGLIPSQLKGKGILPCLPQQTGRTEKDMYDPFDDPNSSAVDKWKPVGKDEEEEVVEVVCSEGEGGRQESVLSKLREMQEENSIEKMKQVFEDYKRGFKIPRKNYPHMVDSSLYRNHGGFIPRDPDRRSRSQSRSKSDHSSRSHYSRSRSRSRSRRSPSRSRSGSRHRYSRSRSHSYSPRRRRPKYITNYRGRGYRPRGFRGRSRGFYPRNKYRRGGYRTRSPSYYGHYSRHRSRSGSRHRSSSSSRYRSRSRSYSRSPRPRTKAERVMHQVMKAKRKIARKITEAERLERLENDHRHSSDDMKDSDRSARSPPRDYNNKPDLVEIN